MSLPELVHHHDKNADSSSYSAPRILGDGSHATPQFHADALLGTSVCQIAIMPKIGEAIPGRENEPVPLRWRIKLIFKRVISAKTKRTLKRKIDNLYLFVFKRSKRATQAPAHMAAVPAAQGFQAGATIRVRSEEEIRATLNSWGELRGCAFMGGMAPYCGTVQRVFKPIQRFVDERDYRAKRTRGVYILEGIFCQGLEGYGHCDRSCFYFWREEWLEKVN